MFNGKPILIVEDDVLIGLDLADTVEDNDGKVVGPITTVREALEMLGSVPIAAAIIDVQLSDRDVTPLALRLAEAGVPFVIHTGTGAPRAVVEVIPDVAIVMKPAAPAVVARQLAAEIGKGTDISGP
jgi:DNA-binding NtrC family response regulator